MRSHIELMILEKWEGSLTCLTGQLLMKINPQRNYERFLMRVQRHATVYV